MGRSSSFHPTAAVDDPDAVGSGTAVWHFCHVMAGAKVGRDCVLGQNVFVAAGAVVGDRVRIQNNVSIYSGVAIEDDVFVGPSAVFTNVKHPRAEIDRREAFETTRVRRGATVGANATVLPGVTIGRYAFVGAGAVVTRD
ncbi:MAG TPA: acyltransferase, partial [Minicystis sp.]|nr:acyltransferase [Minicystis sp.]